MKNRDWFWLDGLFAALWYLLLFAICACSLSLALVVYGQEPPVLAYKVAAELERFPPYATATDQWWKCSQHAKWLRLECERRRGLLWPEERERAEATIAALDRYALLWERLFKAHQYAHEATGRVHLHELRMMLTEEQWGRAQMPPLLYGEPPRVPKEKRSTAAALKAAACE